ncbi:MAG: hypothetical protein QNK25_08110 [Desulfobacterales bacterium]|nr:hypothetical protein [Desulfobacterales bacterium]
MKTIWTCLVVLAMLVSTSAWASEETFNSVLNQHFGVYGGAQLYQADGEFSSTKDGRPKTTVDLDDLGLDEDEITPVFGAFVNFGKRWTLRFDYYGYHEDAKKTAEFDFDFDDEIVTAGARLDTSLDLDVYVVNLAYNLYATERAKFGVGLGAHIADIDLKIASQITLGGGAIFEQEDSLNYTAPLPNIYVGGAYAFTDKCLFRYSGGWMSLSYGDYDGDLITGTAVLEYWPFQHAGLGIGYRYVKVKVDYDPGHKKENYDVELPGPVVYAIFGF